MQQEGIFYYMLFSWAKATSPTGLSFSSTSPSSSMINIPVEGGQPEGEDNDSTMYILETWTLFTQPPTNANHLCVCSVAQPCPTLCHSLDCSLPGSSVHGIFNGNPFQYSCLENSMDRGVRQDTVNRIAKSRTGLCSFLFSLLFHHNKSSRETPTA